MKRWWGIRHVRCIWHARRVYRWAREWSYHGIGLGIPNEYDLRVLDDIWAGKA